MNRAEGKRKRETLSSRDRLVSMEFGAVVFRVPRARNAICARRVKARPRLIDLTFITGIKRRTSGRPKITAMVIFVQLFTSGRPNHVICGQRDVPPLRAPLALIFARRGAIPARSPLRGFVA